MKFSDGINVNTEGELRTLHVEDGWYVVGEGMLIPCADKDEAEAMLEEMKKEGGEK